MKYPFHRHLLLRNKARRNITLEGHPGEKTELESCIVFEETPKRAVGASVQLGGGFQGNTRLLPTKRWRMWRFLANTRLFFGASNCNTCIEYHIIESSFRKSLFPTSHLHDGYTSQICCGFPIYFLLKKGQRYFGVSNFKTLQPTFFLITCI